MKIKTVCINKYRDVIHKFNNLIFIFIFNNRVTLGLDFPLDGELNFYLKNDLFIKNDLELPLIFVLFLKG